MWEIKSHICLAPKPTISPLHHDKQKVQFQHKKQKCPLSSRYFCGVTDIIMPLSLPLPQSWWCSDSWNLDSSLAWEKGICQCHYIKDLEMGWVPQTNAWAQCNPKTSHSKRRQCKSQRDWKMLCYWLWRWKPGPGAREWGHLWKLEKVRDFLLEAPRITQQHSHLGLVSKTHFWASGLQNCKAIRLCCISH